MKSIINIKEPQNEQKQEYPCIKQATSENGINVVLFIAKSKGVVIYSTKKAYKCGYMSDVWNEASFMDFTGTIELSNN